jgi:hypothetical protein
MGIREGWWTTLLPLHQAAAVDNAMASTHRAVSRGLNWLGY